MRFCAAFLQRQGTPYFLGRIFSDIRSLGIFYCFFCGKEKIIWPNTICERPSCAYKIIQTVFPGPAGYHIKIQVKRKENPRTESSMDSILGFC